MDFRMDIIIHYLPVLLKGTLLTIGISVVSILFGSILGLGIGFGKMSTQNGICAGIFIHISTFFGEHRCMCRF